MRFFLDNDVPQEIANVLSREHHEIVHLRNVLPDRSPDEQALEYAAAHDLFLITCNRDDFLRLAKAQPNPGLIILIRRRTRHLECAYLLRLIDRAGRSGLTGNINFA